MAFIKPLVGQNKLFSFEIELFTQAPAAADLAKAQRVNTEMRF
jgi:hypothetical protein